MRRRALPCSPHTHHLQSLSKPPKFNHASYVQLVVCTDIALLARAGEDCHDLRTSTVDECKGDRLRFQHQWALSCVSVGAVLERIDGTDRFRFDILIVNNGQEAASGEGGVGGGRDSMQTTVDKYKLEFARKDDCEQCYAALIAAKDKWEKVQQQQKAASDTMNRRSGRRERSWAKNKRTSGTGVGGKFGTLEGLKAKYATAKMRGVVEGEEGGAATIGTGTGAALISPSGRRASEEGRRAFADALKAQKEQEVAGKRGGGGGKP